MRRIHHSQLVMVASLALLGLAPAIATAEDVITIGIGSGKPGTSVMVPVYVQDNPGTLLGMDQPAGEKIQAFSLKVSFMPAAAVIGASILRDGVLLAGHPPLFESLRYFGNSVGYIGSFSETINPILFTQPSSAPGDLVFVLVVDIANNATAGTVITLNLDVLTTCLANQGGTVGETHPHNALTLVNGSITVLTPNPRPLMVSISGTGNGTVTSSPSGINCPTTCSADFPENLDVTLTATASPDSVFAGWTGACTGAGPCVIRMTEAKSVNAKFNPIGGYFSLSAPCRLYDSRSIGGPSGTQPFPIGPYESRIIPVVNSCGVPVTAIAIASNITGVNASAAGDIEVIAGNLSSTGTSTLCVPLNRARANNAIVQLATNGAGTIRVINKTSGTMHIILDVSGYFN